MHIAKAGCRGERLSLQSMSTALGRGRVNVTLTSITLKHEETSRTSHTGQGCTAAHCHCFCGLPPPNKRGNPPWGRGPAQRETLKLSCCNLHLRLNIFWHHIQQCLKQPSLPSLILMRPIITPDRADLLRIWNCASRAASANGGHKLLQTKSCHEQP